MRLISSREDSPEQRLALFDFAFQHAPIGIALLDTRGCIERGNAAFARLVGIPVDQVPGTPISEFTHPDDLEEDLALFQELLDGKRDGYSIEKRYLRPDGGIVFVLIHVAAMRDASGSVARVISQIQDITVHKEHERELAERAAQLELAMETVRGGFWHMDVATGVFETSDRLAKFIGGPEAARLDLQRYVNKVNADDGAATDLSPLLNGQVDMSVAEYRLRTIAGERWIRCDRRLLRDEQGRPSRIVGVAIDFTEEHLRLEELERRSQTDALTGLLNRHGLETRFGKFASSSGFALLAVDLDGFKRVNDELGHPAGDAVLVETARRFETCIRQNDLLARIGGDEFVAVVSGGAEAGEAVAERLVSEMRRPVRLGETEMSVRATAGGCWSPDNRGLDALIAQADQLLYEAKAAGKDCWRFSRRADVPAR